MSTTRKEQRQARHLRIRNRISCGTAERPRMAIHVSNKHMYVQFINDEASCTLAAASTLKTDGAKCNLETARLVGEAAAAAAKEKGISAVVVDRGGFKYHGRVKTIVESAVAAGLRITAKEESK